MGSLEFAFPGLDVSAEGEKVLVHGGVHCALERAEVEWNTISAA